MLVLRAETKACVNATHPRELDPTAVGNGPPIGVGAIKAKAVRSLTWEEMKRRRAHMRDKRLFDQGWNVNHQGESNGQAQCLEGQSINRNLPKSLKGHPEAPSSWKCHNEEKPVGEGTAH